MIAGGVIVAIAAIAIGSNQVITQQRNASATATAVANARATETAVANARATATAVAEISALARVWIMEQSSASRASFLSRFRTYMTNRVRTLRGIQTTNNNMIRTINNAKSANIAVDLMKSWLSRDAALYLNMLLDLGKSFTPNNIPKPYEVAYTASISMIAYEDNDIVSGYATLEKYVYGRNVNRDTIVTQFDIIISSITTALEDVPRILQSFEDIDNGKDTNW